MNRQELIEKYQRIYHVSSKPGYRSDPFSRGEDAGSARCSFEIVDDLKKLDEPQRVKVPGCVDKYLNFCMKIEMSLAEALKRETPSGFYGPYPDDFRFINEALVWLESSMNQNIFANAWLHGWEVEEEPKYEVDFGHDAILYQADDDFWIEARENNEGYFKQQFTEKEIKSIDERYWPFAVPAEKV